MNIESRLLEIKSSIFSRLIIAYAVLGFVAYIPSLILSVTVGLWTIAVVDTIAYLIILIFLFIRSIPLQLKVITTLLISLSIGVLLLIYVGPDGAGYLWLFTVPVIAGVLLESKYTYSALAINFLVLIILGFLQYNGVLDWDRQFNFSVTTWVVICVNFMLLNMGAALPLTLFIKKLKKSMVAESEIADKLSEERLRLIEAKRQAEAANKLKTEFLAQMSHEVRSPINTMLNFVSLIKEEIPKPHSEDVNFSFQAIENSSKRIIRTIDMILNMSQIQSGYIECNFQDLDLVRDVLQSVIREYSALAKSRDLELIFENKSLDSMVHADAYTVTQLFVNIIDNAIKYTNQGKIIVSVYRSSTGRLSVDVQDTGIGMSEEYIKKMFTPFLQEDRGYTRQFDGNGLGLALVDNYCRLNNLQIDVKSKKGEGSTFSITF
ncbi:MAG: sensor histidine kinase [Syntrophothermus sp.]